MDEAVNLKARLDAIEARIQQASEKLKLRGLFHKDHQATAEELLKRYRLLTDQLNGEVASLEAHGHHVDSLEKTVLNWVNGFGFDR